jgi:ketosteroid isomerase-like protein
LDQSRTPETLSCIKEPQAAVPHMTHREAVPRRSDHMLHVRYLAAAPLALLLGACGSSADPDSVIETVRATEQAQLQAIAARDLRGAVRNYEDGAVLVTPGVPPAEGGAAIAAAFEGMLADPNLKIAVTPGPAWVSASGDLAVTTSTARYTTSEPGSERPVELAVGNQTVWRKPTGKPWMIVSDYNVELPEPDAAAAAAADGAE